MTYVTKIAQLNAQEAKGPLTTRQINTLGRTALMVHNVNCASAGRIYGKDAEKWLREYAKAFRNFKTA